MTGLDWQNDAGPNDAGQNDVLSHGGVAAMSGEMSSSCHSALHHSAKVWLIGGDEDSQILVAQLTLGASKWKLSGGTVPVSIDSLIIGG